MDDIRVLQFRLGSETYSVPVNEVGAVLQSNRVSKYRQPDADESIDQNNRFLQVLDSQAMLAARDGMTTIILHVNGMQVALVVDEVIKEVNLDKISIQNSTIVPLTLWKLGERKWIGSLSRISSYIN
jgi:chemotaxis signal transduction protein